MNNNNLISSDGIELNHWYYDNKDFNNLKKEFDKIKNYNGYNHYNLSDIALKLEEISSYKTFHDENIISLIWIFHQFRIYINDKNKSEKILDYINKFIHIMRVSEDLYLEKKDSHNDILKRNFSFQSIVVEGVKKITNDIKPSLSKCLTLKDKEDIIKKLSSYESVEENEKMLTIEKTDQYKILEKFNKYPILHKYINQINTLIDLALSNDTNSPIAKAAITYLLDEEDVIPDEYGIMGLIDDIYAIDLAIKNTSPTKFSDLVDFHDSLFPEFSLPTLGTLNNPLSTLGYETICKVSYTNIDDNKNLKRHMVLRDVGLVPLLVGMGRSIVDRIEKSKLNLNYEISFSVGDHIIVGTKKLKTSEKPIVAVYSGEIGDGYHFIEGKSSKGNEKKAIKSSFLKECSATDIQEVSSFNDINKCISDGSGEISLWKNINFTRNIEKLKSKGKIFFFSDKREFEEMLNEKIFDKSIKSWFGIVTIGQKFEKARTEIFSNTIFPSAQFYHIYDEISARQILLGDWGDIKKDLKADPILIISASESFHKNEDFIRELALSPYDVVAFSDLYQKDSKVFSDNDFDTKYISPSSFNYKMNGLEKFNSMEGFINRSFEFDINFEDLNFSEASHFVKINKIIKEINNTVIDLPHTIMVLKKFLYDFKKRLVPSSETYFKDTREKLLEILNKLEFLSTNDSNYKKLYNYLNDNFESILSSNRLPFIKNFIANQNKDKKIIFLSPSNQVRKLSAQLASFPNVIVADFNKIQSLGDKDLLIIPFFFGRLISRKLRNNRYASEHLFFCDTDERLLIEKLINFDKKVFENHFGNRDGVDNDYFFNEVNDIETDLEFYSGYDKNSITEISNKLGLYNNADKIDSNLIVLDEGMKYIAPWGGKALVIRANNPKELIEYSNVRNLVQGDKLIIPESNISGQEILDVIIKKNEKINSTYIKLKNESSVWRDLLKDYVVNNNLEISEVLQLLENNDIKRKKDTIINWLYRDDIIAPQNKKYVIPIIMKLSGISDQSAIKECIESCEHLIRLRQDSLNHLNKTLLGYDLSKAMDLQIDIMINEIIFRFNIHEIIDTKKIINSPSLLYKLYNDDDLRNAAIPNNNIDVI